MMWDYQSLNCLVGFPIWSSKIYQKNRHFYLKKSSQKITKFVLDHQDRGYIALIHLNVSYLRNLKYLSFHPTHSPQIIINSKRNSSQLDSLSCHSFYHLLSSYPIHQPWPSPKLSLSNNLLYKNISKYVTNIYQPLLVHAHTYPSNSKHFYMIAANCIKYVRAISSPINESAIFKKSEINMIFISS